MRSTHTTTAAHTHCLAAGHAGKQKNSCEGHGQPAGKWSRNLRIRWRSLSLHSKKRIKSVNICWEKLKDIRGYCSQCFHILSTNSFPVGYSLTSKMKPWGNFEILHILLSQGSPHVFSPFNWPINVLYSCLPLILVASQACMFRFFNFEPTWRGGQGAWLGNKTFPSVTCHKT